LWVERTEVSQLHGDCIWRSQTQSAFYQAQGCTNSRDTLREFTDFLRLGPRIKITMIQMIVECNDYFVTGPIRISVWTLFYKKLTNPAEQIFIAVPYPVFVNCAVSFAELRSSLLAVRPALSTIFKKGIKNVARIPERMAKLLL